MKPVDRMMLEIGKLRAALESDMEALNDCVRASLYRAIAEQDFEFLNRWIFVDGVAYERSLGVTLDPALMRPPWEALH